MLRVVMLCALTLRLGAQALTVDDVLRSVEANYPPLLATLLESQVADGATQQARGQFDTQLGVTAGADQFGYYPNQRLDVGVNQNLRWQGASAYGGWRVGAGDFPAYRGLDETRNLGEFRAGIKVPLLRGREIDERRAALAQAEIGQRIASLTIDQQRLLVRQLATNRYWDWAAAGQRLRIAQDLLRVARERDQALQDAADLGAVARVEVTENRRQILQREAQIIEAQRGVQQASIALSLFYRDATGQPRIAQDSQLPASLPATEVLDGAQVTEDLARALTKRPEIAAVAAQRSQTRIDIDLASNQTRPSMDFGLGVTSEAGSGAVKRGPNEVKATLTFQVPWQRRVAEGKLQQASAKHSQLTQREQFARDQVSAEVQDAASAVRAAHERTLLATREVSVALDLADAERERFRLGDSTLFLVNLREQAAVDAELREVAANLDYLRALTIYDQVTAKLLP
ncbi:MAG: TolC family protein [Bryobacteraceae bacterium]